MTEETPPPSLAERALSRLRRIAAGNGLEPAAIIILEKQERDFTVGGKLEVAPFCTVETASYPGDIRKKGCTRLRTLVALQEAVATHQKKFRETPDWLSDAIKEIKSYNNQGWGLEDAKIILPEKSVVYAATEICPQCGGRKMLTCTQCNGQGTVVCTQCRGQGREPCYYCAGRGEDPQQPGQRCPTCNGSRLMPCRFCQARGHLPCPTCHGNRGTVCPGCGGSGSSTQEVAITCGAETYFKLIGSDLPSGLRRGIDRIGINNLGKGHADISYSPPTEEDMEAKRAGGRVLALNYQAIIPYAELRMGFGNKKAIVSAVGKRCALSGVPPFLDTPLQPWGEKLHRAATGKSSLQDVLEVRVLQEILSLVVSGKGRIEEVRKLYPFGLSSALMTTLSTDMRLALNKATLKIRTVIAVLCACLCAALFYIAFMVGYEARISWGWRDYAEGAADAGLLIAALGASWLVLNFSTRFVLKQRFPTHAHALRQKIGKTGYTMLASIVVAFILSIGFAPIKPLWLALLIH